MQKDKVLSSTYELLYGYVIHGLFINNKHGYGTGTNSVRYVSVCQQEMTAAFRTVRLNVPVLLHYCTSTVQVGNLNTGHSVSRYHILHRI